MKKQLVCLVLLILVAFCSCSPSKRLAAPTAARQQIAEYDLEDLKYKVYLVPDTGTAGRKKYRNIRLSIMIINMKDNFSPLRRLCSDINEYNTYNEYLLNGAKNEIVLRRGDLTLYPVYYAFENNYNAFPFETVNVGYAMGGSKKSKETILEFTDKVFSKNIISFNISKFLK